MKKISLNLSALVMSLLLAISLPASAQDNDRNDRDDNTTVVDGDRENDGVDDGDDEWGLLGLAGLLGLLGLKRRDRNDHDRHRTGGGTGLGTGTRPAV